MGIHDRMTGAQRVAKRRAALRAQGMKVRQFWLPDMADPAMRERLAREAQDIGAQDAASGVGTYLESIRLDGWADEPDYDWGAAGPPTRDVPAA
jgi:hypothetical protein